VSRLPNVSIARAARRRYTSAMDTPPDPARRGALRLLAVGGAGALGLRAAHAGDEPLSEADPEARTVDYVTDAAKVDAKKFPKFKAGQTCANCSLYGGSPGEAAGGCALFYGGKVVAAKGWCSSWEKRP